MRVWPLAWHWGPFHKPVVSEALQLEHGESEREEVFQMQKGEWISWSWAVCRAASV